MNSYEFNKQITYDISDTKSGYFRSSYHEKKPHNGFLTGSII